jgi:chaperonin GroES
VIPDPTASHFGIPTRTKQARGWFSGIKEETMKVRPLYDRILVKRIEEEQKTAGGLFIPDSAKEKPQQGVIVSVGQGKVQEDGSLRKLELKAGDKILFAKYSGSEIKMDGVEHLILREDDVLGVIE